MRWFPYARLITLTAGTLLPFFWMVVILGHRRQRNFERIFFFLCLALTLFCGSSLLALNAQLYYTFHRSVCCVCLDFSVPRPLVSSRAGRPSACRVCIAAKFDRGFSCEICVAGGSVPSGLRFFASSAKCSSAQARLRLFDAFVPAGRLLQLWLFFRSTSPLTGSGDSCQASTLRTEDASQMAVRRFCFARHCSLAFVLLRTAWISRPAEHTGFFGMDRSLGSHRPIDRSHHGCAGETMSCRSGGNGILSTQSLGFSWLCST